RSRWERLLGGLIICGIGGVGPEDKQLIQTEIPQQILIALVQIDDPQMSLAELAQAQRHAGERSHEGGIHDRTSLEIDDELAETPVDHLLGKLLQPRAVQKRPFPLYPNQNRAVGGADQDGRLGSHGFRIADTWFDAPFEDAQTHRPYRRESKKSSQ